MTQNLVALTAIALCVASSAAAEGSAAGRWLVQGKVASLGFTLSCDFRQQGAALDGACVDGATSDPKVKGGRSHPLTAGAVEGDHVRWTYRSSFLLTHFDVTYEGTLTGDRMSGKVIANGNSGTFTARRAGS